MRKSQCIVQWSNDVKNTLFLIFTVDSLRTPPFSPQALSLRFGGGWRNSLGNISLLLISSLRCVRSHILVSHQVCMSQWLDGVVIVYRAGYYEATNVSGTYPYLIMLARMWEIWQRGWLGVESEFVLGDPSACNCPCVLCLCGVEENWGSGKYIIIYGGKPNNLECSISEYEFSRELESLAYRTCYIPHTQEEFAKAS